MARKRKRRKKTKQPRRAPLRVLLQRGAEAWRRGQEADALRLWERAREKNPTPELAAALGELYFRRGVRAVAANPRDDDTFLNGLADLERAVEFLPGDERPLYHLGLAYHRMGDLQETQTFYQRALELQPDHRRAAYHLALATLEQQRDPAQSLAWALLTPAQQADLQAAWQLLRKQSRRMLRPSTSSGHRSSDTTHPLWSGLAALDGWRADKNQAKQALEQVLAQEKDGAPRSRLARIYLGNLLWPDDPLAAARHWDRAARSPAPPWVEQNRAVGADLLARQALEAADPHAALPYTRIALDYAPDRKPYQEVMAHVHFLLGNEVAGEEQWAQAVDHWEEARRLGGESQPLFHNLALGYEHLEQWGDAAQAWRHYLRRRPRRADVPGVLTPVQERQVRRHIASLYMQAGNENEAFRFYTQALDAHLADEEEIPLRLELAEMLVDHDRWSKAERILRDGLKRHPDHPDLLQPLALLYEERGQGRKAMETWERALQSSPDHPLIRERLADHLTQQGGLAARRGHLDQAQSLYDQALEHAPEDVNIKFGLADIYCRRHRTKDAMRLIDEILEYSPDNPALLSSVIHFWLTKGEDERADALLQRAEGWNSERQATFYAMVGMVYYDFDWPEQGERLLRQAVQTGPIPSSVVVQAATLLLQRRAYSVAVPLLEQALEFDPADPPLSLLLALAYTLQGKRSRARRIIGEARRVAQQIGDYESIPMLDEMSQAMKQNPYAVLSMLSWILSNGEL